MVVVCAVGNPYRGDDGAGIEVAKLLEDKYTVFYCEANPENYIDEIKKLRPQKLIIVDAADFLGKPGDFRKISPSEIDRHTISTHTIPISLFIELIKEYCGEIEVWGIQAKDTDFGRYLSPEVKEGVKKLAELLRG